jgi:hypothetical protein
MALKMEEASTSETLANLYQTAWLIDPEDTHLHALLMWQFVVIIAMPGTVCCGAESASYVFMIRLNP